MKRLHLLICVLVCFCAGLASAANPALLPTPGSDEAQRYERNAERVEDLRGLTKIGSAESRIKALEGLLIEYPGAALDRAAELVSDSNEEVAVAAVRVLAASIVMTDHVHHGSMTPEAEQVIARAEAVRAVLRTLILDGRLVVREEATRSLASMSDPAALKAIDEAASQSKITAVQAVNYLGLAHVKASAPYLEKYLDNGSGSTRKAAIAYLAPYPEYQPRIRDAILFNGEADNATRAYAAQTLSRYDKEFGTYALLVTNDSETPASVAASTVSAYVDTLTAEPNTLTPRMLKALERSVEELRVTNSGDAATKARLNQTLDRLKKLRESE